MSGSNRLELLVHRQDENSLNIENPHGVPVTLFANEEVPVEMEAVEQALGFVSVQGTLEEVWAGEQAGTNAPFWGEEPGRLERVPTPPGTTSTCNPCF